MQCLFLSPQTRVDLVVLELEVLVGKSLVLENEDELSQILSAIDRVTVVNFTNFSVVRTTQNTIELVASKKFR